MARLEGYYWVRPTEKTADKGGPSVWCVEYWDGEAWDCWYTEDDAAFSEIDERRIERGE